MRIVGGAWRGRRLTAPAGRATRPTSDRVREAIFDVLATMLEPVEAAARAKDEVAGVPGDHVAGPFAGHRVLDLFAGSGALGLEALSRGAARCTFVERDGAALAALRANLATLAPPDGAAHLAAADVRRALEADARRGALYTLVLADPPYATFARVQGDLGRSLGPVLAPRAVIVVETSRGEDVRLPWCVERVKRYGDTQVTFLVAAEDAAPDGQPARKESEAS